MSEFKKGDRVIVNPELANGFILPLRDWVKKGRKATVINVWQHLGSSRVNVRIQFDSRKRPKYPDNFQETLRPEELTLIEGVE